jgi:hypothetical protein
MIGWSAEIPQKRQKFDGLPADSVTAVTGPTGVVAS